jgi:CelD/BcsL family acetyltransferase involved in cellulose biosynthesis
VRPADDAPAHELQARLATAGIAPTLGHLEALEGPPADGIEHPAPARTEPVGAIRVRELTNPAAVPELAPAWDKLRAEIVSRGGTVGPFLRPEWMSVQAEALAPQGYRLLTAWRGAELCGLLPLVAESRRLSGAPARMLRSLSDEHSQRFDALVADEDAARALIAHVLRDPGWDVIELRDAVIEPGTGVARLAEAAREEGCAVELWPSLQSPYLPLPATVSGLADLGTAKFRANLKRRKRKLEREVGPVLSECLRGGGDAHELAAAIEDALRLEAAGWKGAAGTAIACDEALVQRYRTLATAFARRGELALYFLVVDGVRRAFKLGIVDDGVCYLFKTGYDPALASYGPGYLLVESMLHDLIRRGVQTLDFLGDDAPWKREWTDRVRPHAWYHVFRDSWRGRALRAWKYAVLPAFRRCLPRAPGVPVAHRAPEPGP